MDRVIYGVAAIAGVVAVVRAWRGPDSSRAARRIFGRNIEEGSRQHRTAKVWDRTIMTVCGTALCVLGILGAIGVIAPHR